MRNSNIQDVVFEYKRADTTMDLLSPLQNKKSILLQKTDNPNLKLYNITIVYTELRRALEQDPDWLEAKDPIYDHLLDLKFVFSQSDLDFKNMKKGCMFNHNPGEGALTLKTELSQSLEHSHH